MSSQLRLTLLPSPDASNNFVQGYPGIPAGTSPNRPLASIEGSLDLRTAVPIKAKWVCVELQKVETLPAGTKTNTFHDVVDPGPLVLWSKLDTEEWSLLSSLDLPFSLQIPEQVPPTVTLENGGVCSLFSTCHNVLNTLPASIKYQLVASVCTKAKLSFLRKSSSNIITTQAPVTIDKHELHSVWPIYCRRDAREITESGVTLVVDRNSRCFGPGDRIVLNATVRCDSDTAEILRGFELTLLETTVFREQKPKEPTVISKTKLPVNVTLDPEMQHTVEVSCPLSADHTTTTLTTAKRIEVTYVVAIRALMGSGIHLNIELPVVITNWRRRISEEAIRRIGPVPSLGLSLSSQLNPSVPIERPITLPTITPHVTNPRSRARTVSSTLAAPPKKSRKGSVDDLGLRLVGSTLKLTDEKRSFRDSPKSADPTAKDVFSSAAEEKERYRKAQGDVDRVVRQMMDVALQRNGASLGSLSPPTSPWPSDEAQKIALFQEATEAVARTRGFESLRRGSSSIRHDDSSSAGGSSSGGSSSRGNRKKRPTTSPSLSRSRSVPSHMNVSDPNAEEQKLLLKLLRDTQGPGSSPAIVGPLSGPIPYGSLYPEANSSNTLPPLQTRKDYNSTFSSSSVIAAKEQLRRMHQQQQAEIGLSPLLESPIDSPTAGRKFATKALLRERDAASKVEIPLKPADSPGGVKPMSALEEKALLRERDAALASKTENAAKPVESGAKVMSALEEKTMLRARDAVLSSNPPKAVDSPAPKFMTAAQEKATMRERDTAPASNSSEPPPLMPRPPHSYIQETRAEDARTSRFTFLPVTEVDEVKLNLPKTPEPPPNPPPKPTGT